jgi:hypothetical protein
MSAIPRKCVFEVKVKIPFMGFGLAANGALM